jgi:hypothetical protein
VQVRFVIGLSFAVRSFRVADGDLLRFSGDGDHVFLEPGDVEIPGPEHDVDLAIVILEKARVPDFCRHGAF